MNRAAAIVCVLVLGGALLQPAAAGARERPRHALDQPIDLVPSGVLDQPDEPQLSEKEAATRAQRQFGGKVLAIHAHGPGYNVKLLKDGEVRTVFIAP